MIETLDTRLVGSTVPGRYHGDQAGYPVLVQRFESVTEWYRYAERSHKYCEREYMDHFYGHSDEITAVAYCEKNIGESHMRKAKELVDKVDTSFRDRQRVSWQASPHGAYAVVPEYLANEPFNMRMKAKETHDKAPIRYYIECVISGGTGLDALEQRATGIAALIMRSVEERPVELYAMIPLKHTSRETPGYIGVIQIQTHPIDLHSTIAAFATREFCRRMAFSCASYAVKDRNAGSVDWLFGHPNQGRGGPREECFRKLLDADPQDVFIQGGYLTDAGLFQRDPVRWVHEQVEKQRVLED